MKDNELKIVFFDDDSSLQVMTSYCGENRAELKIMAPGYRVIGVSKDCTDWIDVKLLDREIEYDFEERIKIVNNYEAISCTFQQDGSCVLMVKYESQEESFRKHIEEYFRKVPASELSLNDEFLQYNSPKTDKEEAFMEAVKQVIKEGVQDFYRPICDPYDPYDGNLFSEGCEIDYMKGMEPSVCCHYNWWSSQAEAFYPERKSRLGTKSEYIAFLAVLVKELVASGKSLEWAWNAVCNDSVELGHYADSRNAHAYMEYTGEREVCGWCDLGNVCKILADDEEAGGFWLAGGDFAVTGSEYPLASVELQNDYGECYTSATGWIVLY